MELKGVVKIIETPDFAIVIVLYGQNTDRTASDLGPEEHLTFLSKEV